MAIAHLERTARPIRVAVDISIWLFQVQAGRGGKNPELRTLFYRLLKLLALPVHPLFVYDGRHKPPFKRGKAVSARSYGNSPIIQRSKDLIERFRFPWHEAPGEAEAECARLQQAGIVDAVMSNDVDALMFGSTFTIMNFSKESGTGTSASTHVTCYSMCKEGHVSNVPLDRAGMILFAMLSGGDYLPSGVPKCGSKLAAQIAKAKFGDDLLKEITSPLPNLDSRLNEWRDRLQYELEENESGWFTTKHKAVRIPETFPDRTILKYYAEPEVSSEDEIAALRRRLLHAWDQEIDPLAIRSFAAEHFEWNYRSGARKVIKLLAEPLVSYRFRLGRPVIGLQHGTLAPNCDTPWLQKVYKSRANFGTDGLSELQMDMLPIDVVGLDLLAEEPNPPLPSQETLPSQGTVTSGDEEDEAECAAEMPPPTHSKSRVTKRYDPFAIEKVWVFETVARLGVPEIVKRWDDEQTAKANKTAPKKPSNRRSGPRKKRPIDPGMKRGSILKYGTLTKEISELSSSPKPHLLETAKGRSSPTRGTSSNPETIDIEADPSFPSMYSLQQTLGEFRYNSREVDELVNSFSSLSIMSPTPRVKRHPAAQQAQLRSRTGVSATGASEIEEPIPSFHDENVVSTSSTLPKAIKMSYSVSNYGRSATPANSREEGRRRSPRKIDQSAPSEVQPDDVFELGEAIGSLSLSVKLDNGGHDAAAKPRRQPASSRMQELDDGLRPSKPRAVESSLSPEKATSSEDPPTSTKGSAAMLRLECDELSQTVLPTKERKGPNTVSQTSQKAKKQSNERQTRQIIGHLENVTTSNGFWEIEPPAQSDHDSADFSARCHLDEHGTGNSHSKEKRVPRVSILDLT